VSAAALARQSLLLDLPLALAGGRRDAARFDLTMSGWHLFVLRTALTIGLAEAKLPPGRGAPSASAASVRSWRAWGWAALCAHDPGRVAPAALAGAFVIARLVDLGVRVHDPSPGAGRRAPIAQPVVASTSAAPKPGGAPAGRRDPPAASAPQAGPSPLRSRLSVRSATR